MFVLLVLDNPTYSISKEVLTVFYNFITAYFGYCIGTYNTESRNNFIYLANNFRNPGRDFTHPTFNPQPRQHLNNLPNHLVDRRQP